MAAPAEYLLPVHDGPWTLQDVLALPEDKGQRIELVDGALLVSPAPSIGHQRILHRLQMQMDPVIPQGCELLPGINVVLDLDEERMLIPDLAVTRNPEASGVYLQGADLVLAVEIISPSSRAVDKVFKHELYAEAGVPHYLVIDPKRSITSAVLFELTGEDYREIARGAEGRIVIERPFPVKLDLNS